MKLEELFELKDGHGGPLSIAPTLGTINRAIVASNVVQKQIKEIKEIDIGEPTRWESTEKGVLYAFWIRERDHYVKLRVPHANLGNITYEAGFFIGRPITCYELGLGNVIGSVY